MFVKLVKMIAGNAAIIAASIFGLVLSNIVVAQDQTQERLLACDRISDAEDRLECFNAVVGGIKEEAEPPSINAEHAEVAVPPSPPAPTAVEAVAPAAVVDDATNLPPAAPEPAVSESAEKPPIAPAAASSDFGLEDQEAKAARQAEREQEKEEQFEAVFSTIVEVRRVTGERFEARLENGQVWRETEATRTVRRPKVGDAVRITPGRFGSYRMKFNNDNRLASVRRIE